MSVKLSLKNIGNYILFTHFFGQGPQQLVGVNEESREYPYFVLQSLFPTRGYLDNTMR